MTDTILFLVSLAISLGCCMHSAYKLGYTKGYHQGKLIAFIEELEREKNK